MTADIGPAWVGWPVMALVTFVVLWLCSAMADDPEDPANDPIHELDGIIRRDPR